MQALPIEAIDADTLLASYFAGVTPQTLPPPAARRFLMLDAFKNITGGNSRLAQQQTTELEALITSAREERSALSAMLTSLTARSAKLLPIGKALEQVTDKAAGITTHLDEITKRLGALD